MGIISAIRERLKRRDKWIKFCNEYRKRNSDNFTFPANFFNIDCVSVDRGTYGEINILGGETFSGVEGIRKVIIGSYCSIASGVTFISHQEHSTNHISTFPFKVMVLGEKFEALSKGDIVIDDDVWIGYGSTILSGVHIGQGAVIMAGSVVSKDIPPYSMCGGVPAKPVKYRFSEDIIQKLLTIDFSKLDDTLVKEHINELYETVTEDTDLSWLPLKNENM